MTPLYAEPSATDERRAQSAARHLVGAEVPAIKLSSPNCYGEIDMAWLSSGRGAVIYLYPGWMPGEYGKRSAAADAAQARAFEAQHHQLAQMDWRLAGISTQEPEEQIRHIHRGEVEDILLEVEHIVLSDPLLLLARGLGLPTYDAGGPRRCYPRLALIAEQGFVTHVMPLSRARASSHSVVAWVRDRSASQPPSRHR